MIYLIFLKYMKISKQTFSKKCLIANFFKKMFDRKLFQKKFDQKRKPFQKRLERKRRNGVINRRNANF